MIVTGFESRPEHVDHVERDHNDEEVVQNMEETDYDADSLAVCWEGARHDRIASDGQEVN